MTNRASENSSLFFPLLSGSWAKNKATDWGRAKWAGLLGQGAECSQQKNKMLVVLTTKLPITHLAIIWRQWGTWPGHTFLMQSHNSQSSAQHSKNEWEEWEKVVHVPGGVHSLDPSHGACLRGSFQNIPCGKSKTIMASTRVRVTGHPLNFNNLDQHVQEWAKDLANLKTENLEKKPKHNPNEIIYSYTGYNKNIQILQDHYIYEHPWEDQEFSNSNKLGKLRAQMRKTN